MQYLMTSQNFVTTRTGRGMSPVTRECVSAHLMDIQYMYSREVNTHGNILQNLGWARKTFSLIQITNGCVLVCLFERNVPVCEWTICHPVPCNILGQMLMTTGAKGKIGHAIYKSLGTSHHCFQNLTLG